MRSHTLFAPALWAAVSKANLHFHIRQFNTSSLSGDISSGSPSIQSLTPPLSTSLASTVTPTTSSESSESSESSSGAPASSLSTAAPSNSTVIITSTAGSLSTSNSTSIATTNASSPAPTACTGCVLQALRPTTITFDEENSSETIWTNVVVTETILTRTITYMDGTAIDTIVTESETISQTKTVLATGAGNQTLAITRTTPFFTWTPEDDITITLEAGPTYVAYTNIYGGLDVDSTPTETTATEILTTAAPEPTCEAEVSYLWLRPTASEDYQYYIQTFADGAPSMGPYAPVSLPPALIAHLKTEPEVSSIFSGSDIATCTIHKTRSPGKTGDPFIVTTAPAFPPEETETAPLLTPTTSTYISKTYESTSTHVTRQGCLRCSKPGDVPLRPTDNGLQPSENSHPDPPNSQRPNDPPQSQARPGDQQRPNPQTPDLPGLIASLLNSPQFTPNPQPRPNDPNQEQHITIGDSVVPIHPAQQTHPSQNNPNQPNDPNHPNNPNNPTDPNNPSPQNSPNHQNPGVVIGSETLTPGQTTTINGVEVVVPSQGGGSSIVVGGSTIAVNPAPTGPPVLTVGENTITANPQGQFIVGTQTLTPGGPAITVDGSTLSLGPSGTIAVVNGVTQTLANAPFATGPPVLTVGGQTVSATVIGGSTQFILGPGQTLTPGGVLTVDGTTFSMPKDGSGSTVVVNGVTSTLNAPGLPVITLNGGSITASVQGGTTAFILGPGQTLTPGGVLTISGTTISMPASASGSVVVINGVTSTLGQSPVTSAAALTIGGKTYSATVRDGTTEYVIGPGTTLKPGEAITVSGTTYSLDPKGTALIINGKTSSMPKTPASNSATTTNSASRSGSTSGSTSGSSSGSSSTTSERAPGNFIASGIGVSDRPASGAKPKGGLDQWAEGIIIGVAGWLVMFL